MIKYAGRKDIVMHITPLNGYLIAPSLWSLRIAKWIGLKTLVDVRAGRLVTYYKTKGSIVRYMMRKTIELGDSVTVEGSQYVRDITETLGIDKTAIYFPNLAK